MGFPRIFFLDFGLRRTLGILERFFFFWSSRPIFGYRCRINWSVKVGGNREERKVFGEILAWLIRLDLVDYPPIHPNTRRTIVILRARRIVHLKLKAMTFSRYSYLRVILFVFVFLQIQCVIAVQKPVGELTPHEIEEKLQVCHTMPFIPIRSLEMDGASSIPILIQNPGVPVGAEPQHP
jgi:hypothetical protein